MMWRGSTTLKFFYETSYVVFNYQYNLPVGGNCNSNQARMTFHCHIPLQYFVILTDPKKRKPVLSLENRFHPCSKVTLHTFCNSNLSWHICLLACIPA